jgi:hypothetical protein
MIDYLHIVASHDRQHPVRSEVFLQEVEWFDVNVRKGGVRTASTLDVAWSINVARE